MSNVIELKKIECMVKTPYDATLKDKIKSLLDLSKNKKDLSEGENLLNQQKQQVLDYIGNNKFIQINCLVEKVNATSIKLGDIIKFEYRTKNYEGVVNFIAGNENHFNYRILSLKK